MPWIWAEGTLARALCSARAVGLHLAALDVREDAGKHHAALAALYDPLGELPVPYAELDRGQRVALLSRELAGRRPEKIRHAGLAIVPEGRRLLPDLTVEDNLSVATYALKGKAADEGRAVTLWMDRNYGYLMLFTGETLPLAQRRRALAVEPMTCAPNAFASGDGLIRLEAGERFEARWGITPG